MKHSTWLFCGTCEGDVPAGLGPADTPSSTLPHGDLPPAPSSGPRAEPVASSAVCTHRTLVGALTSPGSSCRRFLSLPFSHHATGCLDLLFGWPRVLRAFSITSHLNKLLDQPSICLSFPLALFIFQIMSFITASENFHWLCNCGKVPLYGPAFL